MSDQHITCSECGGSFVFTESERQFYESKGLAGPPKRCKACRQARKAADGGRAGGFRGGARDGGFAGRPARGKDSWNGGAPHGQDAPRGGPPAGGAPRGWGRMSGQDAPRAPRSGDAAQGGDRGPSRGRGGYARGAEGAPRGDVGGRDAGFAAGRGRREVVDAPRDARRPKRAGDARPAGAASPEEPRPARPAKTKPERPKFDVTCKECGTAAQVPFKPIEGRDVFCQPCYRARRGVAAPATEPNLDITPPDVTE